MMLADLAQVHQVERPKTAVHDGSAFGTGVPTLRQNFVTVFGAFGAIGDESGGKRTNVSIARVEGSLERTLDEESEIRMPQREVALVEHIIQAASFEESGKPPAYAGTDFIVARSGRIASVYLFFDNLP
jgi:hypothetical protein